MPRSDMRKLLYIDLLIDCNKTVTNGPELNEPGAFSASDLWLINEPHH